MQRLLRSNGSGWLGLWVVCCLVLTLPALAQEQTPAGQQNPPLHRCPMCGQMVGGPPGGGSVMPHQPGMMMGMAGHGMAPQGPAPGAGMAPGIGMITPQPPGATMPGIGMRRRMRAMPQRPGVAMPGMRPGAGMMPGPGPEGNPPGAGVAGVLRLPEVQKELGITGEQRQKLQDIGFESAKSAIQARATLEVLKLELDRLVKAENPDKAAIDKKIQEIAQAQASVMRSSINAQLDARNVLTKEQRARLPEVMQKMRQRPAEPVLPRSPGAAAPAPPVPRKQDKPAPSNPPSSQD